MQRNQCSSGCALLLAHLADHGNSMVPGDKTCPRHQLPLLAWPMSFLLMKLSVTRTTCSFSFFLLRSVSLCLYLFSSFSPLFLSSCTFYFASSSLFRRVAQKVVPDQLVAPAGCENRFYALLHAIWRGTFSLSTRALICSRFFPITLQPCATWPRLYLHAESLLSSSSFFFSCTSHCNEAHLSFKRACR